MKGMEGFIFKEGVKTLVTGRIWNQEELAQLRHMGINRSQGKTLRSTFKDGSLSKD